MDIMGIDKNFWLGKKVFITGHTGFKGGWLSLYLSSLGSEVYGYSLKPQGEKSFFDSCNLNDSLKKSFFGDIRDYSFFEKAFLDSDPEIVFHMAAQPLVKESYINPFDTYEINVLGTLRLFEIIRKNNSKVKAVINVTTDKCYENREWDWPYRENDHLGGFDPYSSSKACSELISSSYQRSFFADKGVNLATARAGNVIGGGDWAVDRLIPDFIRSISNNEPLSIRYPNSIRPWQHVLEALSGYLLLAENLYFNKDKKFSTSWNFGPSDSESISVRFLVEELCRFYPSSKWFHDDSSLNSYESKILKLDSSRAKKILGWNSVWSLSESVEKTINWYNESNKNSDMKEFSINQIIEYIKCSEK
jgi:CDP-glucose 4,6-dehydratase